ncbi:MAG: hypothetical protein ACJA0Q_000635 [Saprospiraceae bacterium]|jgi:hypothetical protein
MKDTENNIKSKFKYNQSDWIKAENLILKEESRRRTIALLRWSGVAALLMVTALLVAPIGNVSELNDLQNRSENTSNDGGLDASVITEIDELKNNEVVKGESISGDLDQRQVGGVNLTSKRTVVKGSYVDLTKQVISGSARIGNDVLDESPNQQGTLSLVNVHTNQVSAELPTAHSENGNFSEVDISPMLVDFRLKNSDFILSKILHEETKSIMFRKEVFISAMAHPGFREGEDKAKIQLSYNVGFLLGKNITKNLVLAGGLQYNNYKSIHQAKSEESYAVTDPTELIDSRTVIDDEEWVVVETTTDNAGNQPINSVSSPDFTVTAINVALVSNSPSSSSSAPSQPIVTPDTLFVPIAQNNQEVIRGYHHLREKAVLVGSVLLPLELQYAVKRFRATAGLSIEYLIHNKVTMDEWDEVDSWTTKEESVVVNNDFSSLNRTMFNFTFGLDYFLIDRVSLGFKGSLGLQDLTDDSYFSNLKFDRNSNLSISLRYHWK